MLESMGLERYKLVRGRGFVKAKQLEAEAAAQQVAYHLRSALKEAEKTMANLHLLPDETQAKLREMETTLRFMADEAAGIKIEEV